MAEFATVTTSISFVSGPLVASPTWVDVSVDHKEITIARGKSGVLAPFEAGTAVLRLNDTHGKYDPSNPSSTYAPNVLPMRQIKVEASFSGSATVGLFRGFIESYAPIIVGVNNAEVILDCTDALAWLANQTIVEPLYDEARSGQRIIDILTDIGWPSALYSVRVTADQALMAEIDEPEGEMNVLEALQDAAESELGDLFVNGSGVITFNDRRQKIDVGGTSTATFGDDITASELPYTGLQRLPFSVRDVVNHAVVSLPDWEPSEFEDATSIGAYGRRSVPYDTQLAEPVEADTIANVLVWRSKNPRERFSAMNVKPQRVPFSASLLWTTVIGAEIGKVWTTKHRPPNVAVISLDHYIIGLEHRIVGSQSWESRFDVAKPDPTTAFFKIGDATLGQIGTGGAISY